MKKVIAVVGASGNFGMRIASNLTKRVGAENVVLIARSNKSIQELRAKFPTSTCLQDDVSSSSSTLFKPGLSFFPSVVVNASGPYDYNGDNASSCFNLALQSARNGSHYVDLADSRDFVEAFQPFIQHQVPSLSSVLVTGASTVPSISIAAVEQCRQEFLKHNVVPRHVDVVINAGLAQRFGQATVETVLKMMRTKFHRLNERGDLSQSLVSGWKWLRSVEFSGLGQSRLVGEVPTPDVTILPRLYPTLKTCRVSAGVNSTLAMLGMSLMSWLPSSMVPSSHWLNRLLEMKPLTRALSDDVGVMQVTCISSSSSSSSSSEPLHWQWTLIGEHGDGPQTPCSTATLLAERLYHQSNPNKNQNQNQNQKNQEISPGCYVGGDPRLNVTLSDLQHYWQQMGFNISFRQNIRAFRSPVSEALCSSGMSMMGNHPIRNAHCFGGYFNGHLIITGSRFWPIRLVLKGMGFLSPTDEPVPVEVWAVPTTDEKLIMHRKMGGVLLRSVMKKHQGCIMETFQPYQRVIQEVRPCENGGFLLIGRRTAWPLPDHIHVLKVFASVTPTSEDKKEFDLFVEASAPFVGHIFGYKGHLKVVSCE